MPAFASTDELNAIMKELWICIASDQRIAGKLLQSRLIVRFEYTDPEGQLTLDASSGHTLEVYAGSSDLVPTVEMHMKAEVANAFWMGKLNVPAAFVAGKIRSKGPVHKVLALIPIIEPAKNIYPIVVSTVRGSAA